MNVDRLSVTVPRELGAALRTLANARGETVSTVVAEAIGLQLRLAALDLALSEADRRFGPIAEELGAEAEAELVAARLPSRRWRWNLTPYKVLLMRIFTVAGRLLPVAALLEGVVVAVIKRILTKLHAENAGRPSALRSPPPRLRLCTSRRFRRMPLR